MSLSRKQLALIHIARKEMGLDDESYRDILAGTAGVRSAKELSDRGFRAVLAEFERLGWRNGTPGSRHASAAKSGMHQRWSADKWRLYSKIEAQLADLGLPWSYADGIARNMFGVRLLRWCTAEQLRKVIAALAYHQGRVRRGAARK